jgi:myosin-light-chain kinase
MLSGWMAFEFETDLEFVHKVTKMDWTFDLGEDNPFDDISENGKKFISDLLVKYPDQRMSASDTLSHPWITVIISLL